MPRYRALRPQNCVVPDRFGVDFDIAYFYGDNTRSTTHGGIVSSPRNIPKLGLRTDCHGEQILVPLLAAQWRNSIRRRAEGFEMKEPDLISAAPFQQKLISLQDAMARDDIRRRDEGFELVAVRRVPSIPQTHLAQSTHQTLGPVLENSSSASEPPTTPSVYSSESWAESLHVISAARSFHSGSSVDSGFLSCHRTDGSRAGSPRTCPNIGSTTMVHTDAPRDLGW